MSNKQDNTDFGDDIVIEEEFSEDSQVGEKYTKKISALKEKLEKCQSDKEEYLLGWQRAQADFINYKKNNESLFKQAKESSSIEMVESLLPVLDSFDMALAGTFDDAFKRWLTGFEYVHAQLKRILEDNGIEEMNPIGQAFSPELHEAIEEVPTDDESLDHTIAQVILKGYKTGGRIIRAAQVKVYKFEK
jgi:molecular chaperone GrpE